MTKSLTEQWRDGTLPDGHYYVQYDKCSPFIREAYGMIELKRCIDSEKIEVLSAVPTYEQFVGLMDDSKELDKAYDKINLLEKKLEIATKALKKYAESDNWFEEDIHGEVWSFQKKSKYPWRIGFKALKEMEGVK